VRQGHEPVGYWYNPNIHPSKEYRARLESVRRVERESGFDFVYNDSYDIEDHLSTIMQDLSQRCLHCFRFRLSRAAEYASENKFDAFTTTLLVSPHQSQVFIQRVGGELEQEYQIPFHRVDFRDGFREGKQRAFDMGLYMQKYCGCVFSERDRYEKKK